MQIGYARVSTVEQTLDLQQDALTKAGCPRIFSDVASGANTDRPGLGEALNFVRPGDTLVVWRLDRLGRSLQHLIQTVTGLQQRQVSFKSLTESLDTTTSGGKLVFHFFGALAEFERDLMRERTLAGLAAPRARGRVDGHPGTARLNTPETVALAQSLTFRPATLSDSVRGRVCSHAALGPQRRSLRQDRRQWSVPHAVCFACVAHFGHKGILVAGRSGGDSQA